MYDDGAVLLREKLPQDGLHVRETARHYLPLVSLLKLVLSNEYDKLLSIIVFYRELQGAIRANTTRPMGGRTATHEWRWLEAG